MEWLAVGAGGAVGAMGRHLVGVWALKLMGVGFPWGTLTVNVVGSFLIGVLVETLALRFHATPELRLFLVTGVMGGFTTFSSFSLDIGLLIEKKQNLLAAVYAFGSLALGVAALFFALWLVRTLMGPQLG